MNDQGRRQGFVTKEEMVAKAEVNAAMSQLFGMPDRFYFLSKEFVVLQLNIEIIPTSKSTVKCAENYIFEKLTYMFL